MPYEDERANKASHSDIIKNPDVQSFLASCDYLREPSDEEGTYLASLFSEPSAIDAELPGGVIAIDGSRYEATTDERMPSTKVGFVKIGAVLIDMGQFRALRVDGGRFVDPFRVADLQRNNSPLTFCLPSSNIRVRGRPTVRESFRASVDAQLRGERTRFDPRDARTSLRSTLFHLASRRPDLGTGDPRRLRLPKCPSCGHEDVPVEDVEDEQTCSNTACSAPIFPADCLRSWEEVNEFQSNVQAMSRFMIAAEHLMPIHYMRYLESNSPETLSKTAFFVDGPLAVFGNAAWLHRCIMDYIAELNARLGRLGLDPVLVVGLQKTGQVVDHVNLIDKYLARNRLLAIDDDYRYAHIVNRPPARNGFGDEEYYGQDLVYKTPSGRVFVFGLPYPWRNKSSATFHQQKVELQNYPTLERALTLLRHFELDLHRNSVIPVALAHKYTSISLVPGGRVLDLFARQRIASESRRTGS